MKKLSYLLIVLAVSFALTGCDVCKENMFTKLGDSLATMGKEGVAKQQILAERKGARASKCAEQKGAEMKKKMGL